MQLMDNEHAGSIFPPDVLARAREYMSSIPGGTGAYSESKGALICRKHVAAGIERRDASPCDPDDIWLTDGASPGVHFLMRALLRDAADGILVPIPQYPLYSATITLYGESLCRPPDGPWSSMRRP
jgi:alanine transaminase